MHEFNLRHRIREAIESSGTESLSEITETVFRSIARKDQPEALRQALPIVIRRELSRDSQIADTGGISPVESPAPAPVFVPPADPVSPAPAQNLARSRTANLRKLKYRLRIGVGNGVYRHILDCTRDDLLFAAAESDRHAVANAEAAERYRKLEKLMTERKVGKVGDLADSDLAELIGGQA